jgi:hypothetical protein
MSAEKSQDFSANFLFTNLPIPKVRDSGFEVSKKSSDFLELSFRSHHGCGAAGAFYSSSLTSSQPRILNLKS